MAGPSSLALLRIVEHHFAETKSQVGGEVAGGDHVAHRQAGDITHRMLEKLDGGGTGPGAFQRALSH